MTIPGWRAQRITRFSYTTRNPIAIPNDNTPGVGTEMRQCSYAGSQGTEGWASFRFGRFGLCAFVQKIGSGCQCACVAERKVGPAASGTIR